MYPFDELKVALAKSGFAVGESYGGFDRRPLTENGDTQILLCTTER
jgi:hypothetical protein